MKCLTPAKPSHSKATLPKGYGVFSKSSAALPICGVWRLFRCPMNGVYLEKQGGKRLIAQVKPRVYQEAVKSLRKAAEIMRREKKLVEWKRYLKELRQQHVRKRRLIEILDDLDGNPIVKRSN